MKKHIVVLIAAVSLFLTACGSSEEPAAPENNNEAPAAESAQLENDDPFENAESEPAEEADEGADSPEDVTVTLPADFMEEVDGDPEEILAAEEEEGIRDISVDDEGAVTYTMSGEKHSEMMEELAADLRESMDEIENSGDFPSIQEVENNESFSEFTFIVEREAYEEGFDAFASFAIAISGMFYQLFAGVDPDDYEVVVHAEDEETGEVFETVTFPDDME
ncbi:hypothetical protein [Alkalicoccus halolimnae]|uniref:Antigen I/II N-terminal domain-containing protein n=1 Tax=Alkalicoccus halolimnae TaxID=1667239 RepID=A0A5C7F4F7_9BACI|nr:hypothetical protein [Alkalicoccus halolimnae]TXF85541.1 hypothetical protein FTX54_08085 [Alkalicoccus halolimnae]